MEAGRHIYLLKFHLGIVKYTYMFIDLAKKRCTVVGMARSANHGVGIVLGIALVKLNKNYKS